MAMLYAITREVSAAIGRCELTHLTRLEIDVARARAQHAAYERALEACGAAILRADREPEMPDAVFVEDTAVVVPEGAVIMQPGAPSRSAECESIIRLLSQHRTCARIYAPATIDGGDVLRIGKTFFVGRSARTNVDGVEQFAAIVGRWGYRVEPVEVTGCLHLKSAVTCVGEGIILVNPKWVDASVFGTVDVLEVDAAEEYAANGLPIGGKLIYPDHFPRTRERLMKRGIDVFTVPADELAKAEGAVTCCSIVFEG